MLTCDVKGAFQQVAIAGKDVWKTAFNTPNRIYVTPVSQQGDLNSTVSLAKMMAHIYEGMIGRDLEYYANNVFGYANFWCSFQDVAIHIFQRSHRNA